MIKIVGFFQGKNTWNIVPVKEYKKSFNHQLAITYLKQEIYESIDREMKHIISGNASSFYAGLRFLFAEVTYLAHLYWGDNSYKKNKESYYVARFMRKFSLLSPECGLHYEVFRHGLMHSHHPKWIIKKGKVVNWYISNSAKLDIFGICIPEFSKQLLTIIDKFIYELEEEQKSNKRIRLKKILETISRAGRIMSGKDLNRYARGDFRKLKVY